MIFQKIGIPKGPRLKILRAVAGEVASSSNSIARDARDADVMRKWLHNWLRVMHHPPLTPTSITYKLLINSMKSYIIIESVDIKWF